MQIPLLLDRSRPESLTGQLVEQLREAIRRGRIPAATRLPSSRDLSEQLAISRNTVVRAYDSLVAEGYLDPRPASGMFVAPRLPDNPFPPAPVAAEPRPPAPSAAEPDAPMNCPGAENCTVVGVDQRGDREKLIRAMEQAGWVKAKAARLLGLTPRQIGYALQKHDVPVRKF